MPPNNQIQKIDLVRQGKTKTFANISDVAEFLNVSKYAVTNASERGVTISAYKINITRKFKNDCLDCGKKLTNSKEAYCDPCYYEDLTGKSLTESSHVMGGEYEPRGLR